MLATELKTRNTSERTVSVEAPARLHFGFLDLNGGTGRRFGSLGLAIDGLVTRVVVTAANAPSRATGVDAERALRIADRLFDVLGLDGAVSIQVGEAIPPHSGLGSGTQLGLALGAAIGRLYGLELDAPRVAALLDRGARSGIGIAAFEQGGFLVDGGRRPGAGPPAVIARLPFPEHWRVLLIFDDTHRGLHGDAERQAFRRLPVFPAEQSARLCRLLAMQILPGLAEQRLDEFGAAITQLQAVIGDYFSTAQGGRYSSPAVARVLEWLLAEGHSGVGQSSWGPTGFVFVEGETEAFRLLAKLEARFARGPLRFQVVTGRNAGARIETPARDADSAFQQPARRSAAPAR